MVSTFAAVLLVDRTGRRPLLLLSWTVMAACLLMLGVYFQLESAGAASDSLGWLPLVAVMFYIFAFSIGVGPVPWLMIGELFAPEVKGAASGIASASNWLAAFVVTLTFTPLVNAITEAGVFWLYSAICCGGAVHVTIVVYETKGRTLQEIQEHFRS